MSFLYVESPNIEFLVTGRPITLSPKGSIRRVNAEEFAQLQANGVPVDPPEYVSNYEL